MNKDENVSPVTKLRVVSDGEDGMRSLEGKLFNVNEQHILDVVSHCTAF